MRGKPFTACIIVCYLITFSGAQTRDKPKVAKRAKLPSFEDPLTKQIFFDDVFTKLVGQRPANLNTVSTKATEAGNPDQAGGRGSHAWAKLISAGTIEDEVKAVKLLVDKNVTSPSDFAGRGYKTVRREFSILAMLFGIISEYDDDVRWKRDSAVARDSFARSASNAKAGGNSNVFKEAQLRREDLGRLLRGSGLEGKPQRTENIWDELVDRAVLMQRLEIAFNERLSGWTGSEREFSRNVESVLHEAEIIGAISRVLASTGMDDADDEDYAAFVKRMQTAASAVAEATKLENPNRARQAAGEMNKACSECHELYR